MATFTFELRDDKGTNPLKECFVHQVEQTRINAQNQGLKKQNNLKNSPGWINVLNYFWLSFVSYNSWNWMYEKNTTKTQQLKNNNDNNNKKKEKKVFKK